MPTKFMLPLPHREPQILTKAREEGDANQALSSGNCTPYTLTFWTSVAHRLRNRAAAECLDAFLTLNRCPVARFTPPSPAPKPAR